ASRGERRKSGHASLPTFGYARDDSAGAHSWGLVSGASVGGASAGGAPPAFGAVSGAKVGAPGTGPRAGAAAAPGLLPSRLKVSILAAVRSSFTLSPTI